MFEGAPKNELPQEVIIQNTELKVNSEGKKYNYERNGVYYGGDYLTELPREIDLDLPPPPPENNVVI